MRRINFMVIIIAILCSFSTSVLSQDLKAKTEDGKDVMLLPDGTWEYVMPSEHHPLPPSSKPQQSKTVIKGKRGTYGIWIDDDKWRMSEDIFILGTDLYFTHKAGNAYAMIIDDATRISFDLLKIVALENITKVAPNAKIVYEDKRTINATEVHYMIIEGTSQTVPSTFLCYCYTGVAGTIQIITYTAKNLFDEFESDFIEFFNSFEIYSPSQREINFADGSKYSGGIVNGKMSGSGTYTWPNGDQYVGEFVDNRATGGWFYKSGGRTVWCYQNEQGIWVIKEHH